MMLLPLHDILGSISICSGIMCVSIIMSAGWVFPGLVSWSKQFRRKHGVYPEEMYPGILVKLARMPRSVRDKIILPELMKMEGL